MKSTWNIRVNVSTAYQGNVRATFI